MQESDMTQEDTLRTQTGEGCVSLCRLTACPADLCDEIHRVCLEAPGYFLSVEGQLPTPESIQEWFNEEELPLGCTTEHHFVYGIALDARMVGVAHVLAACRDPEQATIGLLLLSEQQQGKGIGRTVFELLQAQMLGWGMKSCLIGVVASNESAVAFWKSMGFAELSEMAPMAGMLDRTIVMEKKLG
jgi:GNAT superfamily N-acetyltransferase